MRRYLIYGVVCAIFVPGVAAGASWSGYRFAPNAQQIDLASNTAWTLSLDDGPARPIKVTAGGWNSDRQEPPIASDAVKDHVVYERPLEIPAEAKGNVVKLLFGGCNYGAEVFLDDRKVAEHNAPMTLFEADLTGLAKPGKTYRLRIKACTRYHFGRPPIVPVGFDFNKGTSAVRVFDGCTKYAYGLTATSGWRSTRRSTWPRSSCGLRFGKINCRRTLAAECHRRGEASHGRGLAGAMEGAGLEVPGPAADCSGRPSQLDQTVVVGAGPLEAWPGELLVAEPSFPRGLPARLALAQIGGQRQRPDVPRASPAFWFRGICRGALLLHGQRRSFHQLRRQQQLRAGRRIRLLDRNALLPTARGRAEGMPGDLAALPADRIQLDAAVNQRAHRVHAGDGRRGRLHARTGGRLVGERHQTFHKENFSRQLQATIRACRNHPCVARYSLANESLPAAFASPANPWRGLIDAALEVNDTRPCVFEVNNGQTGAVPGMKRGHAQQMEHYRPIVKSGDHLRGMGECAWATDGMQGFPALALKMRLYDYAHFAPWSWLNFWPNFLEGMNHDRHPWKSNDHDDRSDRVDGWGSPGVVAVQQALHPYLVADREWLESGVIDSGHVNPRPALRPEVRYRAGEKVSRAVEVFNGGLAGRTSS